MFDYFSGCVDSRHPAKHREINQLILSTFNFSGAGSNLIYETWEWYDFVEASQDVRFVHPLLSGWKISTTGEAYETGIRNHAQSQEVSGC